MDGGAGVFVQEAKPEAAVVSNSEARVVSSWGPTKLVPEPEGSSAPVPETSGNVSGWGQPAAPGSSRSNPSIFSQTATWKPPQGDEIVAFSLSPCGLTREFTHQQYLATAEGEQRCNAEESDSEESLDSFDSDGPRQFDFYYGKCSKCNALLKKAWVRSCSLYLIAAGQCRRCGEEAATSD